MLPEEIHVRFSCHIPPLISLSVLCVCLGALTPAFTSAKGPASVPQGTNFTVEGKITRLAPNRITLSSEGNMIFHVRYDDKTEIKRQDGSPGSEKNLRVGLKVRVDGDLTESGEIVAQKIQLQEEQPPKKSSAVLDSAQGGLSTRSAFPSPCFFPRPADRCNPPQPHPTGLFRST